MKSLQVIVNEFKESSFRDEKEKLVIVNVDKILQIYRKKKFTQIGMNNFTINLSYQLYTYIHEE